MVHSNSAGTTTEKQGALAKDCYLSDGVSIGYN